jgi:Mg-chelatase subunit ChlD
MIKTVYAFLFAIIFSSALAGVDLELIDSYTVDNKTTVTFSATDSELNIPIHNISKELLKVSENNEEILNFTDFKTLQSDINAFLLLVDISKSMAEQKIGNQSRLQASIQAVEEFITNKRDQDYIAIVAFAGEQYVYSIFSRDFDVLIAGLNKLKNVDAGLPYTALYDSILYGCGLFSSINGEDVQKMIILLTDGKNNPRHITSKYEDVRGFVQQSSIQLNCIGIGDRELDKVTLEKLSLMSGGLFLVANNPEEINEFYRNILRKFPSRIKFSYISTTEPGADRELVVSHNERGTSINQFLEPIVGNTFLWIWYAGGGLLLFVVILIVIIINIKRRKRLMETQQASFSKIQTNSIKPLPTSKHDVSIRDIGQISDTKIGGLPLRNQQDDDKRTHLRDNGEQFRSPSQRGIDSDHRIRKPEKTVLLGKDTQPPVAWLVIIKGPRKGKTFDIKSDFTIGRDLSCDLVLNDTAISAKHAQIKRVDNKFHIYDLASTNGVWVNGEKVFHKEINDGCKITLGESEMIFKELNTNDNKEEK